jgi:hypothetical protein
MAGGEEGISTILGHDPYANWLFYISQRIFCNKPFLFRQSKSPIVGSSRSLFKIESTAET